MTDFPTTPADGEPTTGDARAWPAGWGAPPAMWSAPVDAPTPRRLGSRPVLLAGATMLAVGIAGGAVLTEMFAKGDSNLNANTVVTTVDTGSLPASAQGAAVSVAERLSPAVGTIVNRANGHGAVGSGFVISHGGGLSYLITNNHVVASATSLTVVMPSGSTFTGTVVGTDAIDDLAVVSVPDPNASLTVAVFGKSSDLKVGQVVIAIGSPLAQQGAVTEGVISALHRQITAADVGGSNPETLLDVLQTDASINPGNSGGPLADTAGRVVGVNVANNQQGQGIGYSIPSDVAQRVANQLINHQQPKVPFIGVGTLDSVAAAENGQSFNGPGVLVTKVQAGSPAEQAQIHVNDIIVKLDGVTLDYGETIGGILQRHAAGDKVDAVLQRGSQTLTVTLTLAERPLNPSG